MESTTPPEKTLLLVYLRYGEDEEFFSLFRGEGYRIERCYSGAETLKRLATNEPDLLVIYGYWQEGMTGIELIKQVNQALPDRKMRLMFLHNGQYFDEGHEFGVKWDFPGASVFLSRYTPTRIFLPILKRLEAMDEAGGD